MSSEKSIHSPKVDEMLAQLAGAKVVSNWMSRVVSGRYHSQRIMTPHHICHTLQSLLFLQNAIWNIERPGVVPLTILSGLEGVL